MANYAGIIDTKIYELEDNVTPSCKNDRIRIIEYGEKIARVCTVNKNTGHIYGNLCCKIKSDDNINIEEDRWMIRKRMISVRGIRSKSL